MKRCSSMNDLFCSKELRSRTRVPFMLHPRWHCSQYLIFEPLKKSRQVMPISARLSTIFYHHQACQLSYPKVQWLLKSYDATFQYGVFWSLSLSCLQWFSLTLILIYCAFFCSIACTVVQNVQKRIMTQHLLDWKSCKIHHKNIDFCLILREIPCQVWTTVHFSVTTATAFHSIS